MEAPGVWCACAAAELVRSVEDGVPVMQATVDELARLERDQERVSSGTLSAAILRDPLMTLRVLRYLQSHRTRSQTADITTIAHAIMMLGLARFFREFAALPALEAPLATAPQAAEVAHALMSRARLAALYARDWALQRHDLDPEQIMVAALLHDLAELLALLRWPRGRAGYPGPGALGSRAGLHARLGLPNLVAELAEDSDIASPRRLNVQLACDLARHCAHGWQDVALADDLARVQRLLHISAAEVWARVRRTALAAAREWRYYGVRPAAAYLPLMVDAPPTVDASPTVGASPDAAPSAPLDDAL
ncbi:MAG: HDOD domain-containing protein [Burkholderiales bacterium]|nr:HDOD domain-containing protein [Burkholderiales bacterium]